MSTKKPIKTQLRADLINFIKFIGRFIIGSALSYLLMRLYFNLDFAAIIGFVLLIGSTAMILTLRKYIYAWESLFITGMVLLAFVFLLQDYRFLNGSGTIEEFTLRFLYLSLGACGYILYTSLMGVSRFAKKIDVGKKMLGKTT